MCLYVHVCTPIHGCALLMRPEDIKYPALSFSSSFAWVSGEGFSLNLELDSRQLSAIALLSLPSMVPGLQGHNLTRLFFSVGVGNSYACSKCSSQHIEASLQPPKQLYYTLRLLWVGNGNVPMMLRLHSTPVNDSKSLARVYLRKQLAFVDVGLFLRNVMLSSWVGAGSALEFMFAWL